MFSILSIIGGTGSGKTTLLEKVVAELKKRGLQIAVIKHSHHAEIGIDKDGKDSQHYTKAGAEIVIVSGTQELFLMQKTGRDLSPDEITCFISPDIDLVLTEGFRNAATPKIEVHRKEIEPNLLSKPDQLLAVVTDEKLDVNVPQFDIDKDNTTGIADLIEKWLAGQPDKEFQLVINNKLVETNPFVTDFIANTLAKMVSGLKGVDDIKSLRISLANKSKSST